MNNINEILDYIYSKKKKNHESPVVLKELLSRVGSPQNNYKTIYITGTNGKGSTSYFTAKLLEKLGYKVGLYTSPYIITFLERFQINSSNILEADFIRIFNLLNPIILAYEKEHNITLSFFDVLTFIAFYYFSEQNIDYLVLECGIGVAHDSTNVVRPLYSIITSIGLDHKDKLGDTLELVALDKSHIIIKDSKCYTYYDEKTANVFLKRAKDVRGTIVFVDKPKDIKYNIEFSEFNVNDRLYKTSLLGEFQPFNLTLALTGFLDHFNISYNDILDVLKFNMPCRFERFNNFILDGAHNTHAIKSLVKSLKLYNLDNVLICFSALSDKDYSKMIDLLKDYDVCFYLFNDQRSIKEYPTCFKVYTDINELLSIEDRTVLFTGSLHFVSFVRSFLVN